MRSKSYTIIGTPIPWQRARLNGARFYDNQVNDKVAFGLHLSQAHGNEPLFSVPVILDITFYMKMPQSLKKGSIYHSNVPDLDNLIKFILDSSQGVILENDKLVSVISAKKLYDKSPRTVFTLTEAL